VSWLRLKKSFELKLMLGTWGGFLKKFCKWLDIGTLEELWSWKTLSSFEKDGEAHAGVINQFWWRRTLILQCNFVSFFCFFPIWYGLIPFSNHYKGNNCVDMYFMMHFVLSFTFDFYSCYIDSICLKITSYV